METLLMRMLRPILDKLGSKWKTTTGVCLLALVSVAYAAGLLDALAPRTGQWFGEAFDTGGELLAWLDGLAGVVFGVGVIHRSSRTA